MHRLRQLPAPTLGDVTAGAPLESIDVFEPWNPILPGLVDTWRFESENEWPPLAQRGGAWAEPIWATGTCASDGRALAVHSDGGGPGGAGEVRIALPIPHGGTWQITPRLFGHGAPPTGKASIVVGDPELAAWKIGDLAGLASVAKDACVDLPAREVLTNEPVVPLTLRCEGPCAFALDRTWLSATGASGQRAGPFPSPPAR